ncbi:hypothetical protein [Flagellimonas pacifica]|uniref:Membrane metalloprotease n=1 Tax=Flagellimonas pacifica TaxID=1247520 RepID=A0A285MYN1_9FLAO|nr:hypothetical protein [Allomuricauda parva]SNZ01647.1 hypothetical protein SAMN06265377_3489 [Allomuricauda parva]
MKKKIIFYSLLGLGLILACSKDSDDAPLTQNVDKSANLLATGASANDILSNTSFDKLLIEIAYVSGFRPTPTSISNLENYLKARTFKESIEFTYKELSSPNEETLILDEIDELEKENRTAYNDGKTLAIYIYFADAPSDGDDIENIEEGLVTLGAVYRNTSMVIYESTVRLLANRSTSISITDVESATLHHEFGHLFGLVNLGTQSVNDHEGTTTNENDEEVGNNHCNVQGCLMRAELQFGGTNKNSRVASKSVLQSACNLPGMGIMKLLEQKTSKGLSAMPALDAECVLDLQSNGGR